MARDRILSAQPHPDEESVDLALRPKRLDEMVGQRALLDKLRIAMTAARQRHEPLEHMLLEGPPGLGKTTLAFVVAHEMGGRTPRVTSGPAIAKQADLMAMLTTLERGDVLFIDEIHRLPRIVEEFLYTALEDFRVDFTIEGGLSGRVVNFKLNRFTLIGATTRSGLLTAALRDRFGHRYHFSFYDADELNTVLTRSATKLGVAHADDALRIIARRSRGTPRVANRLLRRVRDYAQVCADGRITPRIAEEALTVQQVDALGLDELDRAFLKTLMSVYGGGPAGIEALAATMGEERDTLEDVVEPFLLQVGFVIRTRAGRQATGEAYRHLGMKQPPLVPPPQDAAGAKLF